MHLHHITQQPDIPQQLFLLFHGYGSNAENMQPIAHTLAAAFPQAMVVCVPATEFADCGSGYQWFGLQGITETNRSIRAKAALPSFIEAIQHWQSVANITPAATALFGFSQGGIMCLEAAQHTPALAGRFIAHSARFATLPKISNDIAPQITLHLIHGKEDTVIPYKYCLTATEILDRLGADFTTDILPNLAHTISDESFELIVERLKGHVPKYLWESALQTAAELNISNS